MVNLQSEFLEFHDNIKLSYSDNAELRQKRDILLQKLKDGEIDMLSDVSYTTARADQILYSRIPMTSETYYIFIKAGRLYNF